MITVALPLWNAGDIAWLCLESLCRQEVDEPWELLICEEPKPNPFGLNGVEGYINRLRDAGMVDLNYIIQEKWVGLAHKWRRMANMASDKSECFFMCAADNYYQKNMLHNGYKGIKDGADWHSTYRCHFYDINTQRLVMYHFKRYSGIEMCMDIELARKIKGSNKKKGIDLFVLRTVDPQRKAWDEGEDGLNTLCTHGKNMISWNRGKLINNVKGPWFRDPDRDLVDILPMEVIEKLKHEDNLIHKD